MQSRIATCTARGAARHVRVFVGHGAGTDVVYAGDVVAYVGAFDTLCCQISALARYCYPHRGKSMPQEALSQHVSVVDAGRAKAAKEIGAAMLAATACPLLLNWTDVIKTRMQSRPLNGVLRSCTAAPYSQGFSSTGLRILREEGALQLWGTAMPASLLREVIVIGTRIGAYPTVRNLLSTFSSAGIVAGGESSVWSKFGAGIVLGIASGTLASPCDVVRIRMQAEAGRLDETGRLLTTGLRAGSPRQLHSTAHAFGVVFSEGGTFRGLSVNVLRSCCMTVGTVPVYEHTKFIAKTQLGVPDDFVLHLGAGVVAGLVGTTVTAPADVVRTRIMATSGSLESGSITQAVASVWRYHGPGGFVRGWLPAYLRIGPLFVGMPALVEQIRSRIFGLGYIE
jgi:hypothetical protein